MATPNFFIIGAPKCGTSSLFAYLSSHPQVHASRVKEPHYFCEDLPGLRRLVDRDSYLRLYDGDHPKHRAIGEASTHYLRSRVAVRNILKFNPAARFIAMLRNPTDLAHSLHAQLLYDFSENVESFETAWRLQETRAAGNHLAPGNREPSECQYGQVAAIGEQVQRLLQVAPRKQVHLVFADDFFRRTDEVYRNVLSFLELRIDGRTHFPRINPGTTYRSNRLASFVINPPFPLNHLKHRLKSSLGWTETRIGKWFYGRMTIARERPGMPEALRAELTDFFAEDVRLLQELTGRDLTAWLPASGRGDSVSHSDVRHVSPNVILTQTVT